MTTSLGGWLTLLAAVGRAIDGGGCAAAIKPSSDTNRNFFLSKAAPGCGVL